jgi:hypothetical protein
MSKRALIFAAGVGIIIFASMSVSGRDRPAAAELNTSNRLVRGDFNNDGIVLFPTDVIPAARVAFGIDPPPQPLVIPLDADGYLAVHEQGVVDVNVVSLPPPTNGLEFKTVVVDIGSGALTPTGVQAAIDAAMPQLNGLGADGWTLVGPPDAPGCYTGCWITYTLQREVP